ncbi:MAG: Ig-like domain-containing protein [Streptococcaceae bacterium]|jgi:cell wall-associated NlpC family hydrolase|nr:Ig-like domain-containing protein [Streptococcaceae bacterium]
MNKKKIIAIVSILFVIMIAEGANAATVKSVKAVFPKATLFLKETTKIKATISPKKSSQKVTFATSNKKVATVDKKGKITAKSVGKAVITVKTTNKKVSYKKTIQVKKKVLVRKLSLGTTSLQVQRQKKLTLKGQITPSNATNKKILWQSSNPNIATVSSTGIVQGKQLGTTQIKAVSVDGGKSSVLQVKVIPVKVTGIEAWADSYNIQPGWKTTLWESVQPTNADNQSVTWISKTPQIATTTPDGQVTALRAGTATFLARTAEGNFTKEVSILIKTPIQTRDVVILAKDLIGRPYVWGGIGEYGFDCSGFTQYVFQRTRGVDIGRTTFVQQAISLKTSTRIKKVTRIKKEEIQKKAIPGDLICFNTTYDHIGIYIGENQMIHAPLPGMHVGIQDLQWLPPDFAIHIDWKE